MAHVACRTLWPKHPTMTESFTLEKIEQAMLAGGNEQGLDIRELDLGLKLLEAATPVLGAVKGPKQGPLSGKEARVSCTRPELPAWAVLLALGCALSSVQVFARPQVLAWLCRRCSRWCAQASCLPSSTSQSSLVPRLVPSTSAR
jgi:hypothetical protein